MEVAGLVVGVAGLAGLFSTCLDALDKTQHYRNSAEDMHHLETQFQAENLRFQQWGRDIGLQRGETPKEGHHKALEDVDTRKTIQEILQIIYTLCQPGDEGSTRLNRSPGQHVLSSSRKQRVAWALWGKGKREEEVKLFKDLVQSLYNLVPPEPPTHDATAEQASKATLADHLNKTHLLDEVRQFIARRDAERKVELRQHLQSWLLGTYSTNNVYHESIQRRLDGTCTWVTDRSEFQSWLSKKSQSSLLWINGPAGFGKTVLCARVVQYLTETLTTPVAHFFFSSDFESQAEPFVVIRSWIYQLMLQDEGIFDLVYDAWLELVDKRAANHVVEKLFEDIVSSAPNCVLVLDGIDECKSLGELEHTPFEVMKKATSKHGVRILIVSRNEPDIRHALEDDDGIQCFNEYKITTQDVRQDTESYSRSIVEKKLSSKAEDIKNDVTQRMAARCDGQFLWLKMQGDNLRRGMNKVQLQRAVNNTPSGLMQIYERNWESISSFEPPEMKRAYSLLRWTAFSIRPLTVGEITEAVLIEDDSDEVPIEELPDQFDEDYINTEILDLCGSLIEVRQGQRDASNQSMTVHVTHFSVRQYLLQKISGTVQVLGANGRLQASNEVLENTLLAKRCLQYIQFSGMWSEVKHGIEFSRLASYVKHSSTEPLGKQFREYAAESWFTHVKSGSQEMIAHTVNAFLEPGSHSLRGWSAWIDKQMIDKEPKYSGRIIISKINSLCYATWLGLQFSVIHLLESEDHVIDGQDRLRRSPLAISCRLGHTGIARILLDAGASVTTKDLKEQTPLHTALEHGHNDIARMLVKHGADCNAKNRDGWTPLCAASDSGDIVLARTMVESGADVNALSKFDWTPILLATTSGHIEIVRLLLEKGANLNLANEHNWTPALAATANGYLDILKLLVENGANISNPSSSGQSLVNAATKNEHGSVSRFLLDQEDNNTTPRSNIEGWAPLHIAAGTGDGRTDIIQFLLDKGADTSVRNHDGQTPLFMAARTGRLSAARVLVSSGASLDVTDNAGCTPLFRAISKGYFDLANYLVEQGASPHIKVGLGWTQLHVAAQSGRLDVVKYLFENLNELYVRDDRLLMPLHYASLLGYVEVVQYLASQGVDVNAKDVDGETPLHKASNRGHLEVVKVLVEKGASVNAQCDRFYTPLSLTIGRGQLEIVKFFFDNGFHPHLLNDKRCPLPPLLMASEQGKLDIAEYLLNNGAVVDIRDSSGDTSTIAAAREGHTKLLQLLINKGADIEATNLEGWTALKAASGSGQIETAQLLIDHGAKIHSSMYINIETSMAGGNKQEGVAQLLLKKMAGASHHTLHSAVCGRDLNLVHQLVEQGADINLKDENQQTALMLASRHGNVDIIMYLIDQGADIDAYSSNSKVTALLIAVKAGWRNVVRLLVEKGADISATDRSGWTVLHFACQRNFLALARFLIAHGADPLARTKAGSTTLGIAAIGSKSNPGFVDLLVGCGVCVADGDTDGWTPLHSAVRNNQDLSFIRQLLERRADPNVKLNDGSQPMLYAALAGDLPTVRLLHEYGASIKSRRNNDGSTPLHAAAQEGHHIIVEWLLEHGADISACDEKRFTALHQASAPDHLVTMKVLINRGAYLDAPDYRGFTPLHHAASLPKHGPPLINALLGAGAEPRVAADDGITPLHQCAVWGERSHLTLLLDHGADLHSEDLAGRTALHMASESGNVEGARFLCEEGSSLTRATKTGQTPLLVAASQGRIDLVTLLIGHGADIHARDNDGYGCLHLSARAEHYDVTKLFLDLGISVNARANDDATPLHGAAVEGNLDIVKLLISKGADINATKLSGVTPLMRAISYGHITIFRLLLEHGATVGKHTYLLNLAKMQLRDTREY